MKAMKSVCIYILCLLYLPSAAYESDIITLVFPYGAGSYAMGEVGTSLADDESALFWNQAGLGMNDPRMQTGEISLFYEPLLPALGIRELWHCATVVGYTLPSNWGALAFFHNYLNTGGNYFTGDSGKRYYRKNCYEQVFATGWGVGFGAFGDTTDFAGLSFKYIDSKMFLYRIESFAFDIGYIKKLKWGLRLGFTLQNMGPAVYDGEQDDEENPLPFTLNLALGSKNEITFRHIKLFEITGEMRLCKEFAVINKNGKPDPFWKAFYTEWSDEPFRDEMRQVQINTGFELGILNTVYLRQGYLIDIFGQRFELHCGAGLNLFDHFNFDFGLIVAPEGFMRGLDPDGEGAYGIRNLQWQTSLSFVRIGSWSERDERWWEVSR